MNNVEPDYSRETFLKLLAENFSAYDVKHGVIEFRNTKSKYIAEAIGMGESQFSKMVNNLPGKEYDYKRIITRLLLYRDARKYNSQKTLTRLFAVLSFFLVMTLAFFLFVSDSKYEGEVNSSVATIPTDGIYLLSPSSLEDILDYNALANTQRLKWEAVMLNQSIKNRHNPLSTEEVIIEIANIIEGVDRIVNAERELLSTLNFTLPSGKNLSDFIEEVIPTKDGKMFNFSAEEILNI